MSFRRKYGEDGETGLTMMNLMRLEPLKMLSGERNKDMK